MATIAPRTTGRGRIKPLDDILATAEKKGLKRSLGAFQLTLLGIGAVIGTGIFVLTATAAQKAGPGMMVSFIVAGAVCAVAALCYSELASMVPVAGSAYTYSYAVMGEMMAWMVGWALILEYALGASAVAVGWSGFMSGLLDSVGVHIPHALKVGPPIQWGFLQGGEIGGVFNLPAVLVVAFVTTLLVIGTKESATFNAVLVCIKVAALTLFLIITLPMVSGHAANFEPFAPRGWGNPLSSSGTGILGAAASIFFAYVGFDAVSTAAEETKNPQRNLPIGILGGLAICTVIYVIVGAVLTGMVPYRELAVADPLARALELAGFTTVGWFVALGAAVSMSAVLLVFQYGQPRIFFAMGRDGLLPQWAAKLNPKTRVPSTTTIITGVFVAFWALIGDAAETYDLTNIGTLFAFMLVSIGVLVLRYTEPDRPRPFKVRFVWAVCLLSAAGCLFIMYGLPRQAWERFIAWLAIGLVLYFAYGYRHSKLRQRA